MYLPNSHLVSRPSSPASGISGCTVKQHGMKAVQRGSKTNLTTHTQCRHIQTHFINLLLIKNLHSSCILPSDSTRLGKPHVRRIKGSLSYLPSPSSVLPFEIFHVNNRWFPNQSLLLVHGLEDKRAILLFRLLWCIKYARYLMWSWLKESWGSCGVIQVKAEEKEIYPTLGLDRTLLIVNKILKLASAKAMLSLGKATKMLLVHTCPISLFFGWHHCNKKGQM